MFGFDIPVMPCTENLHDCWEKAGRCGIGQSGAVPLSWTELQAYAALSCTELRPYEAQCLIEMSRAYCVEISNSNPLRISPMERQA